MQSIVHRSGIRSCFYVTYGFDLKLMSQHNLLSKFANDAILIIHENTDVSTEHGLEDVFHWSYFNQSTVNISKSKEMFLHHSEMHQLHDHH